MTTDPLPGSKEVDRTPKPCLHKIANHVHGTRTCYVLDKCRCIPCKDANRIVARTTARAQLYGRWEPYVDAEPVRQHLMALRAQGLGPKRVATLAGVPHGSLSKLVYGAPERGMAPSKRVRQHTADRILAVTADLDNLGQRTVVDGTGTARRLQALIAAGWSMSKLGRMLGVEPGNFYKNTLGRDVSAMRARAVRDLYECLAFTPPPEGNQRERGAASRSRNRAQAAGWPPPIWWDEDDLDNPAFVVPPATSSLDSHEDVDGIAVALACEGKHVDLTIAERREVVRRLHRAGLNDQQIAQRTGMADHTALRIRRELDLPANRSAA